MSSQKNPERNTPLYLDVARVTGFATSLDPEQLVAETHDPYAIHLNEVVGAQSEYIVQQYEKQNPPVQQKFTELYLRNNLGDVRTFTENLIGMHPAHENLEVIKGMSRSPDIIQTLAGLATQPSALSAIMVDNKHQTHYFMSPDGEELLATDQVSTPNIRRHCPATYDRGLIEPAPIFTRFVPWGMEVAARSLLTYKADRKS